MINKIRALILFLLLVSGNAFAGGLERAAPFFVVGVSGPPVKLLGIDSIAVQDWSLSANFVIGTQWVASDTGTINEIRTDLRASGNFDFGIYTDTGDAPDVLLASTGIIALTSGGIRTASIADVSVVAGTKYWLMANSDVSNSLSGDIGVIGYKVRFKANALASGMPNPLTATSAATGQILVAGYGN